MSIEVIDRDIADIQKESVRDRRKVLGAELKAIQGVIMSRLGGLRLTDETDYRSKAWVDARSTLKDTEVEVARYISFLRFARPNARIGVRGLVALTSPNNEGELIPLARGAYVDGRIAGVKVQMIPVQHSDGPDSARPLFPSAMLRLRNPVIHQTDPRSETTSSESFDEEILIPLIFGNINAFPILDKSQVFAVDLATRAMDTYNNPFSSGDFDFYLPQPNEETVLTGSDEVQFEDGFEAIPDYILDLPEDLPLSAEEPMRIMKAMQEKVFEFFSRQPKPAADMSTEEVVAFGEKVIGQVAFETYGSETMAMGNILIARGDGGFAVQTGEEHATWQSMSDDEMLMGEIKGLSVSRVPSKDTMVDAYGHAEFNVSNVTMSAMLVLGNAKFYYDRQPDGEYAQEADFSAEDQRILLPAAYGIHVQIIDVNALGPSE